MERYIKEYADAKVNELNQNDLVQPKIKTLIIERIARAIELKKMGYLTFDETIRTILNAATDIVIPN